jgi:hypothetical protein
MTTRHGLLAAALAACWFFPPALAASAAKDDQPASPQAEAGEAVKNIALAYKLADYARSHKAPMALVAAAEILCRVRLTDPASDPERGKNRIKIEPGNDKPAAVNLDLLKEDAKRFLDEVPRMSGADRPAVVDEVKRVAELAKEVRPRGTPNGAIMYTMRLGPGQTDTYSIKFNQGEWARITVHAGGAAQLAVKAATTKGDRRAEDAGHDPALAWIPQQPDGNNYKVTVTNQGSAEVLYQLFTN